MGIKKNIKGVAGIPINVAAQALYTFERRVHGEETITPNLSGKNARGTLDQRTNRLGKYAGHFAIVKSFPDTSGYMGEGQAQFTALALEQLGVITDSTKLVGVRAMTDGAAVASKEASRSVETSKLLVEVLQREFDQDTFTKANTAPIDVNNPLDSAEAAIEDFEADAPTGLSADNLSFVAVMNRSSALTHFDRTRGSVDRITRAGISIMNYADLHTGQSGWGPKQT